MNQSKKEKSRLIIGTCKRRVYSDSNPVYSTRQTDYFQGVASWMQALAWGHVVTCRIPTRRSECKSRRQLPLELKKEENLTVAQPSKNPLNLYSSINSSQEALRFHPDDHCALVTGFVLAAPFFSLIREKKEEENGRRRMPAVHENTQRRRESKGNLRSMLGIACEVYLRAAIVATAQKRDPELPMVKIIPLSWNGLYGKHRLLGNHQRVRKRSLQSCDAYGSGASPAQNSVKTEGKEAELAEALTGQAA